MTYGSGREIGSGYSEEEHNIGKGKGKGKFKGKLPFSYSSSTSSSSTSSHHQYKSRSIALVPPNNWNSQIYETHNLQRVNESPPQITLDLMDSSPSANRSSIEKEHMFDKVMTPSDVGKLNRLVIPKQFAEKYFPLDSSANEKGLLLNFEDRNGKSWRFRYSYWNSSQSYVMTKGWSRFVKEMKLDAGDIVSFQRGVGELGKDCLYIDWRRRPDAPDNISSLQSNFLPYPHNFSFQHRSNNSWNPLLMRPLQLPNTTAALVPREYVHFPRQFHYDSSHIGGHNNIYNYGNVVNSIPASFGPVVRSVGGIESLVPVIQGKAAAKRLRLFGVNMDCPLTESDEEYSCDVLSSSSRAPAPVPAALRFYNGTPLQGLPTNHHNNQNFLNKGKSTSMSFDFDM